MKKNSITIRRGRLCAKARGLLGLEPLLVVLVHELLFVDGAARGALRDYFAEHGSRGEKDRGLNWIAKWAVSSSNPHKIMRAQSLPSPPLNAPS